MGSQGVAACSDEEFIGLFQQGLSPSQIAKHLGIMERNVYARRRSIERRRDIRLEAPSKIQNALAAKHAARIDLEIRNGISLIGSDVHKVLQEDTLMQRAFLFFCKEFKPVTVFQN